MAKKILADILAKTKSSDRTPDKQGKDDSKSMKKQKAKPFWTSRKQG